jgi:hypothetical protein
MQTDKNVIILKEEDKAYLIGNCKSLMDDSSDFFSENYENYLKDL